MDAWGRCGRASLCEGFKRLRALSWSFITGEPKIKLKKLLVGTRSKPSWRGVARCHTGGGGVEEDLMQI
jgi:hypothetical protein